MTIRLQGWCGLAVLVVAHAAAAEAHAGGNQPPSVPVLERPADGDYVTTSTPVLAWAPSTDPQGDAITYEVEVTDGDGIVVGSRRAITGTVTAIDADLTNFATYAWRARAADDQGAASELSLANVFVVCVPDVCCGGAPCPPEFPPDDAGCGGCQAHDPRGTGALLGLALAVLALVGRRRPA